APGISAGARTARWRARALGAAYSRSRAAGEFLQVSGIPGQDEHVVLLDPGRIGRVHERLTRPLHPQHGYAELRTNLGVADRCPLNRLRGAHLHDREVVFHLDEIEHPARYEVRYPGARVVFAVHHVVGADPLEDPA